MNVHHHLIHLARLNHLNGVTAFPFTSGLPHPFLTFFSVFENIGDENQNPTNILPNGCGFRSHLAFLEW